jgi:hypothetical protein
MDVKYKCTECGFEWIQQKPGMVTCLHCRGDRVDWVNYDEWDAHYRKTEGER